MDAGRSGWTNPMDTPARSLVQQNAISEDMPSGWPLDGLDGFKAEKALKTTKQPQSQGWSRKKRRLTGSWSLQGGYTTMTILPPL